MHESPWRVTAYSEERVVKIPVSLQVVIRDSPFPLYIPPDVFIGVDYNFYGFGTRMASLYHLSFLCHQTSSSSHRLSSLDFLVVSYTSVPCSLETSENISSSLQHSLKSSLTRSEMKRTSPLPPPNLPIKGRHASAFNFLQGKFLPNFQVFLNLNYCHWAKGHKTGFPHLLYPSFTGGLTLHFSMS